ncbi:sulfatase-like hydrolase/transferase [Mediterraneibacter sp. NSJ-55]|uniref:Sulfatase-like hydrolase/transferase n=1 Tax=Mediterraneibacter hominis TaxID=2763054 RepID=A0A923LM53_9FIRM|nr:sulfatase-like hydrolase/transferase [Mediterraneibacter hominis]MBC5690456.1 sulfatase-like hydrolase/transferase [Mediterraneibacter hominis]
MNKKNILLIMTDQHRNDFVGYMPNSRMDTPNIDRIANEGTGFMHCQSPNPICTPARTALITGRYPRQIGTLTMSGDLFPQIPTFMQALQKAGYETYGIGKFHFQQTWKWGTQVHTGINIKEHEENNKCYGYDHTWEVAGKSLLLNNYCNYADFLNKEGLLQKMEQYVINSGTNSDYPSHNFDQGIPSPLEEKYYIDKVIGEKSREYIDNHDLNNPFYMAVSFCSPHRPYDAPQRYVDMFPLEDKDYYALQEGENLTDEERHNINVQIRQYKAMITLIDEEVGKILQLLEDKEILEDTLIIFTSDHGDMQGDHYRLQKAFPWKQCATVPLAIRMPGFHSKSLVKAPVELTDVAATILDYAGLEPEEALSKSWPAYNNIIPCRSLLPIVRGEAESVRAYSFTETEYTEEQDWTSLKAVNARGGDIPLRKERVNPERTERWQMLQTREYKYIKYNKYKTPGKYHEELYYLVDDPEELRDVSKNPQHRHMIHYFREQLLYLMDNVTIPAQKIWTPVQTWQPENFLEDKQGDHS